MTAPQKTQRDLFEAAVIERMKESGFLEVEIRVECLARCDDGYQDEVINAGWHYWNAALSAAEPVAFTSQGQIDAARSGSTALLHGKRDEFMDIALYAAPPAPSVAVKALEEHVMADFTHLTEHQSLAGPYLVQRIKERFASFALSAQVQDAEEQRTETCERCQGNGEIVTDWERYRHPHENDAGDEAVAECPDCDGIGRVSAQVQDVAGWQPIETAPKDGTVVDLWHEDFGRQPDCYWGKSQHTCGEYGKYCDSDWHSEPDGWVDSAINGPSVSQDDMTHWMPLPSAPAAPAKQEGCTNE